MVFLIIFIVIPFVELMVFAAVSEETGIFNALLFAFLTALIGGALVRNQGLKTIFAMRESMDRGQIPLNEIFDGFCLVAAGAMLITPGFVTDTAGFLLLVPPVRKALRHYIKNHTNWSVDIKTPGNREGVIEGEYEVTNEYKSIDRDKQK